MVKNTKKNLNPARNRSFLNKDFNDFRSQLLDYARTYFPDKIQDFSEASLGGLLLDFAAYVGDSTSFYLDHQFRELDPQTAVERENIEALARSAGVKIQGASPAVAGVEFLMKVPAEPVGSVYKPKNSTLPVIKAGTVITADNDVTFNLTEDLDFSEVDEFGNLKAGLKVFEFNSDGTPNTYILSREGQCVSGVRVSETFSIPDDSVPFRTITLGSPNVTGILDVRDSEGNIYYEVDFLSQDTVFASTLNIQDDNSIVNNNIEVIPAPYRYVTETESRSFVTTIRFGSGNAGVLDGDIVPDPSELALPLFGKKTFSKFSLDPNNLLKTKTLGISPRNTTITVQYRAGGGLSHNVTSETISNISGLIVDFPNSPTVAEATNVRSSISAANNQPAAGGDQGVTIDQLRGLIASARNSQNRIVTVQDLMARIYTMPSSFGSVFRAGVSKNVRNPLSTNLYIVNRDAEGRLMMSPDSLKKNLVTFLNEFRLVSDAIDILDTRIVNVGIEFKIAVDPNFNSESVLSSAISKLINYMSVENFQIGQPIRLSDLTNLVYNTAGVVSVIELKVVPKNAPVGERSYSSVIHNIPNHTTKGLVLPPEGGIFEVKFPESDIRGAVA